MFQSARPVKDATGERFRLGKQGVFQSARPVKDATLQSLNNLSAADSFNPRVP